MSGSKCSSFLICILWLGWRKRLMDIFPVRQCSASYCIFYSRIQGLRRIGFYLQHMRALNETLLRPCLRKGFCICIILVFLHLGRCPYQSRKHNGGYITYITVLRYHNLVSQCFGTVDQLPLPGKGSPPIPMVCFRIGMRPEKLAEEFLENS